MSARAMVGQRILMSGLVLLGAGYGFRAEALDLADHPNVQELQRPEFLPAKPIEGFELPAVKLPPPQTAPSGSASGARILQRIEFHGNRAIGDDELTRVAAPWLGKPVGLADLESLRLELTRHYVERGYLNSGALLRTSSLSPEGGVGFEIIEGRLADIHIDGLGDLVPEYLRARLHPDPAAVLNVDRLRETFQLLLDDPLFSRIGAQLAPGQRLGEAVLNLDVQRAQPYQLSAQINNYRPPSIGETALGMAGTLRNLTGRGDVLDGHILKPVEGDRAYRAGLGWRMPLNFSGTWLSAQAEDGDSMVIEEPMRAINIRSHLTTWDLGVHQLLMEQLNHRLAVGINYVSRVSRSTLDGRPFSFVAGEPDGVTRARTWKFWQEYTYRSEQQVFALRSTFAHTGNNLETLQGQAAAGQPASSYSTWLGQFQYVRKLTDDGVQLAARLGVQHAARRLLSMDGMSIGGVATVRGFRENQMIRDKGYVANLELDFPLLQAEAGRGHTVNLIPFLDYGKGRNQGDVSEAISSAGVAARWHWQDLTLDLALARRLAHPAEMKFGHGALQDSGAHLQLAYKIW